MMIEHAPRGFERAGSLYVPSERKRRIRRAAPYAGPLGVDEFGVLGATSGTTAWTPANRANLAFWFRPDVGIGLNGSDVASWLDFRGIGLTASQGAPANQPLFVASGSLNSRPCVRFTRANSDILTVASGGPSQQAAHSIFVVCVFNTLHNNYQGVCGLGGLAKSSGIGATNTTGPSWFGGSNLLTPTGGSLSTGVGYRLGKVVQTESAGTSATQGWRDGSTDGSSVNNAYDNTTNVNIGSYDPAGNHGCTADIYEIVGYSDAMSGPDITQLDNYFRAQYDL